MRLRHAVSLTLFVMTLWPNAAGAQLAETSGASLGLVRSQAEKAAVRMAVDLLKKVNVEDQQINKPDWLLFFTPQVNLKTGDEDTFSSITATLSATFVHFDTVVVEGVVTPKSTFYHMVPIAAGMEANRDFTTANGILELGYIPAFQGAAPTLLKTLRVGVFLQAGYKFRRDTVTTGEALPDASSEPGDHGLGRIKGSFRWSPKVPLKESNVSLVTSGDGWADVLNGKFYYHLDGTIRVKLFAEQFLDLKWERGAGAPNFNQGNQFSANLHVTY